MKRRKKNKRKEFFTSKKEAHIILMNYFCFNVQHNRPFICFLWDILYWTPEKKAFFTTFHFTKVVIFIWLKMENYTQIDSPQFQRYSYKAIDYSSIEYLLTNHKSNVTLPIDRHRGDCVSLPHDRSYYSLLNQNSDFANQTLLRNMFVMASLNLWVEWEYAKNWSFIWLTVMVCDCRSQSYQRFQINSECDVS